MNTSLVALSLLVLGHATKTASRPIEPVLPVPTKSQLAWHRCEITTFFHFGVNTFTDREWGEGNENPAIFNPSSLDAKQWVQAAKQAGAGLAILTAKHHDGFCLWPSKYTEHSVKNSPWKNGKGDVVREFTDACHAAGLRVGLYMSPWDRHDARYGTDEYNTHFKDQLTELLTNYGTVDEVWFDGACGEGPNGKKQEYDWNGYFAVIRKLQPNAVIAISGPDIRWVGNESGVAREGESSVQGTGAAAKWYPAECDVSIRPGWFYHASEDSKVKPLDQLLDIYYKSVGRNSVMLLNIPPDKRGLIADPDLARIKQFRAAIDEAHGLNLVAKQRVTADSERDKSGGYAPANTTDTNLDTFWCAKAGARSGRLEYNLGAVREFNLVNIQEPIQYGERSSRYHVEALCDGTWRTVAAGTVIGQRVLLRLGRTKASKVALVIDDARAEPAIAEFGVYLSQRSTGASSGSLTAGRPAKCSAVHPEGTVFGGDKAVDDDMNTRWATPDGTRACWLEVDMLKQEQISHLAIHEFAPRIAKFELQYKVNAADPWQVAYAGNGAGVDFKTDFTPVKARFVRLNILDATDAPSIWEFQVK